MQWPFKKKVILSLYLPQSDMIHTIVRATKETITRRSINETMIKEFQLTADEKAELLPSGSSTVIANRVGWAMHDIFDESWVN